MLQEFLTAFLLGLGTPLFAVCVIPLYPGFIAYLANRGKTNFLTLSLIVTAGVTIFMLILGILFTFLLEISLTKITSILSPIAFALLAIISLLLLFNVDFSKYLPSINSPKATPKLEAFLFGLFFGAIVLPCNPGFIAALFAKTILTASPVLRIGEFLFFGIGIGFPLIALSLLSTTRQQSIITFFTAHKKTLNRVMGTIMLLISLYYLFFVF